MKMVICKIGRFDPVAAEQVHTNSGKSPFMGKKKITIRTMTTWKKRTWACSASRTLSHFEGMETGHGRCEDVSGPTLQTTACACADHGCDDYYLRCWSPKLGMKQRPKPQKV